MRAVSTGGFPASSNCGSRWSSRNTQGVYVDSPLFTRPVGGWEFSLYVGLAGAAFLLFFGLFQWLRDRDAGRGTYALLLPIAGLALLSLNDVFAVVRMVPFPMFTGERVSSRIISLPFVFLLVLAARQFQRWLDRPRRWTGLAALLVIAGLAVGVRDLWENLRIWSILNAQAVFQQLHLSPDRWRLENNYGDRAYIGALVLGSALTLLTAGALLGPGLAREAAGPGRRNETRAGPFTAALVKKITP